MRITNNCNPQLLLVWVCLVFLVLLLVGWCDVTLVEALDHGQRTEDEQNKQQICSLSMEQGGECINPSYQNDELYDELDNNDETNTDTTTIIADTITKEDDGEDEDEDESEDAERDANNSNETNHHFQYPFIVNANVTVDTSTVTNRVASLKKKTYSPDTSPRKYIMKSNWGVDQVVPASDENFVTAAKELNYLTDLYMSKTVSKQKAYRKVRHECKNRDKRCTEWAVNGDCFNNNKPFMQLHCAPVCMTCDMLDIEKRCPVDDGTDKNAWRPGDLNRMFERITDDPFYEEMYGPMDILSRPRESRIDRLSRMREHQDTKQSRTPDGPWLVSFDQFLSEEECARFIEWGEVKQGFEPSYFIGKPSFDGSRVLRDSKGQRTSQSSWCREECSNDPITQNVIQKLENLTGIPKDNIETLEILRYREGQQYEHHFDFSYHELKRQQGARLMTVYLYLNDVKAGGETEFTTLKSKVKVTPRRGKALMWGNVLDSNPDTPDGRVRHRALPVEEGVKYGINVWFHQRDFKTPNAVGCTA